MESTSVLAKVIKEHGRDMTGKTVAITGTTSGTGLVCARELGRAGAAVILLNRPSKRADASLSTLQETGGDFEAVACDLQDFASVRAAAATILDRHDHLDALCNNAGVMALPDQATKDGYDVQMQTNVLSHVLLSKELMPLLGEGRIINHTSMARLGGPLQEPYFGRHGGALGGDGSEEENARFTGPRWERYHQTKLANAVFTYALQERLGDAPVKALLAHPGLAATQLQVTTAQAGGMDAGSPLMEMAQSADDGAAGIVRCCMDPEVRSGDFFGPKEWVGYPHRLQPEPLLQDAKNIEVFWKGCDEAVGPFSP